MNTDKKNADNMPQISEATQKQIEGIADRCRRIKPLVMINCITYNQARYLRQALDGFVMQRTDFPVVAVVHDDASTDGTAATIREYAAHYPDLILPIYETENQYSKRNGSLKRIMQAARNATGAKYVAYCEGDDYWTDPLKLQKQVDYLESHPDYSMCFHNAIVHHENGEKEDHEFYPVETREYSRREVVEHWVVPTASIVLRTLVYNTEYHKRIINSKKLVLGDNPLIRCCGMAGKLYGFNECMSCYRLQPGGFMQNVTDVILYRRCFHEEELIRIFDGDLRDVSERFIRNFSYLVSTFVFKGDFKRAWKLFKLTLKYAPLTSLKKNIVMMFSKVKSIFVKKQS